MSPKRPRESSNLFAAAGMEQDAPRPLPDRLRPAVLSDVVGQDHILGPDGAPSAAGWACLVLAVPAVAVAALAGTARFRRLAFPAVMLLTVLDVALLVAGGGTLV